MFDETINLQQISPDICVGNNMRMVSRAITQAYDTALRPAGITGNQFSLLGTVYRHGPLPVVKLAELMQSDRTTVARNLKVLVRERFVVIEPDEHDRRVKMVSITPAGETVLVLAAPLWAEVQNHFVTGLGEQQLAVLMDALAQLHHLTQAA